MTFELIQRVRHIQYLIQLMENGWKLTFLLNRLEMIMIIFIGAVIKLRFWMNRASNVTIIIIIIFIHSCVAFIHRKIHLHQPQPTEFSFQQTGFYFFVYNFFFRRMFARVNLRVGKKTTIFRLFYCLSVWFSSWFVFFS